jgi:hypothetical protein
MNLLNLKHLKNPRLLLLVLAIVLVSSSLRTEEPINIEFPNGIRLVQLDNLLNTYIVKEDNSIVKLNKEGQIVTSNNFKSYGNLSHIDVSNPFMLYLYYRDQNALLITDNFFNIRSTIKLDQLSSDNIMALGRSVDDGIWIFDQNDYQLEKYNQSLELQQISGNVMSWLRVEPDFNFLIAENKYVYLNSPSAGILVFDQFANYYKTIPIKTKNGFQVQDGKILYQLDSLFLRYDPKFLSTDTLLKTVDAPKMVISQADLLITYDKSNLSLERK